MYRSITNRRIGIVFCAALLACFHGGSAYGREPIDFQPTSNWNLDYAEDKCTLTRVFNDGEDNLFFRLEQSGQAPFYNLSVHGGSIRRSSSDFVEITFGPNEAPTERSFIQGALRENNARFVLMHGIHLAPASETTENGEFVVVDIGPEREEAITHVTLAIGLRRPIRIHLESMRAPLEAMRTCVADLVNSLKLDEEGLAQVVTGPRPKNELELARFIQERYPSRMLRNEEGGSVLVRLTVNPNGNPTSCQIAKSDRPAVFDDYVCFGMLRIAEFEPAVGPDGEARYGVWTTRVTYRIN